MPTVCTSKRSFGNRDRREICWSRRLAGHYRKRGSRKANIELEDLNRFGGELHRWKERASRCIACGDELVAVVICCGVGILRFNVRTSFSATRTSEFHIGGSPADRFMTVC